MATESSANRPVTGADLAAVLKAAGLVVLRTSLLVTAVSLLVLVRSNENPAIHLAVLGGSLGCIYLAMGGSFRWWAVYVVGFMVFVELRSYGDELGVPVQYEYAIVLERALFLGSIPTIWLQDQLYTYGNLGPLEAYTIFVYLSYFAAPHIVAFAVWKWDRERFGRYALGFLGTLYIGLITCAILPTAPPWLASQTGELGHVYQVIPDISGEVTPGAYGQAYEVAGVNPVAAMPSLHAGVPWLITLALWRYPVWRWVALSYAASMSFAVVYLGEHYFVDALAGGAAAAVAWFIAGQILGLRTPRTDPATADCASVRDADVRPSTTGTTPPDTAAD